MKSLVNPFTKKTLSLLTTCFFFMVAIMVVAAGTFSAPKISAQDNKTPVSALDAWKIVSWWDSSTSYVSEGAKMSIQGNTDGNAWEKGGKINWNGELDHVFDVSNGQTVDFKFSLGLADADATSNNGDQFDVVFNSNDKELFRLRIFFTAGSITNGSHSVDLYKGGEWTSLVQDIWVSGDASLSSEFHFAFNKEDLLLAKYNGSDEMRPVDVNGTLKKELSDILPSVESINVDIRGNNGFNKNVDFVVKEINGQSLANDGANFTEDIAPVISVGTVGAATVGENYTLPVKTADLFTATDSIKYHVDFGDAASEDYTYTDGQNQVTFNKAGNYTLKVTAEDSAGNLSQPAEISVQAVSAIEAPVIDGTPTIGDIIVNKGDVFSVDAPTVTETSGSYTLELVIFNAEEEEIYAFPVNKATGKFDVEIPYSLESGKYFAVFRAANVGGTTVSEKVEFNLTVNPFTASDLIGGAGVAVNEDGGALVDETDSGVRIRTDINWSKYTLGKDIRFDARSGREIVFTIPKTTAGTDNALMGGRVDFIIYNPVLYDEETSPNGSLDEYGNIVENYAMLGVWGGTGADRPTNVYVKTKAFGEWAKDITDTGWIKTNETDTQISFRMRFDAESYFSAERTGGMTQAMNDKDSEIVKTSIASLVEVWNTDILASAVQLGNLGSGEMKFELIVNSVDNVAMTEDADAVIVARNVPSIVKAGEDCVLDVYGYDFFGGNKMTLTVVDPDGVSESVAEADGYVFNGDKLGEYKFTYVLTGGNGKEIKEEFTVVVKDIYEEIALETEGSYATTFEIGDEIEILPLKANDKIASYTVEIIKPDGSKSEVAAGVKEKLSMSGVYKIVYMALDKAQPEPTAFVKEFALNVIDTVKPVVTVGETAEKVKVGNTVTIGTISVTDDSNYVINVKVTAPDGGEQTLTPDSDGNYSFKAETKGEYKIKITVTDDYDNSEIKELTVTATGGCSCGAVSAAETILLSVVALAAGVWLMSRRKNKA